MDVICNDFMFVVYVQLYAYIKRILFVIFSDKFPLPAERKRTEKTKFLWMDIRMEKRRKRENDKLRLHLINI